MSCVYLSDVISIRVKDSACENLIIKRTFEHTKENFDESKEGRDNLELKCPTRHVTFQMILNLLLV